VEAYVPTGERSLGIAVSPDGATAVVANAEDNHTSILDIASGTNLVNLPTSQRPAEVAISPDGQRAFVTSIAGTDRIHFIDLDGANSSVTGSLVAGQMGSILYTYNVVSGIAVSPDGNILAACISFDDELLLVDTATQSEIARVPVGDFPIRVAFSADGNLAFVTHSFSDDLYIVSIDGGSSQVEAVVPGIEFPLDVVVSGDGSHAYVASFDFNAPSVKVVATSTATVVNTVVLNDQPRRLHLCETNSILYAMTTAGELVRITASGPTSTVIDSTSLSAGGSDLDFNEATLTAVVAQPIPDGVDIVREILLGDVNRDGIVSLLDVAPFVDLLSQGGFQLEADINQDGVVSLLDVSLFVELLSGP
jgi:YVTN family beta-propeller protein